MNDVRRSKKSVMQCITMGVVSVYLRFVSLHTKRGVYEEEEGLGDGRRGGYA